MAAETAPAAETSPDSALSAVDFSTEEEDRQTPEKLRREILARDGCRCLNCESHERLQVHHVVYLSHGGRTEASNLLTVCVSCHGLIHQGLLFVKGVEMGVVPKRVWFADRDGQPIGRRAWADAATGPLFQVPEQPKEGSDCAGGERSPDGERSPRDGRRPTTLSLDEIPDVVTREWWDAHEHLFVSCKRGLRIKKSALRDNPL